MNKIGNEDDNFIKVNVQAVYNGLRRMKSL